MGSDALFGALEATAVTPLRESTADGNRRSFGPDCYSFQVSSQINSPIAVYPAAGSDDVDNEPTPGSLEFKAAGVRVVFAGNHHHNAYGRGGDLEMLTRGRQVARSVPTRQAFGWLRSIQTVWSTSITFWA